MLYHFVEGNVFDENIENNIEVEVADMIKTGIRNPDWIACACIMHFDPERRSYGLLYFARSQYIRQVARRQLGLPDPDRNDPDARNAPEQLLAEADALKRHADAQMRWAERREQDGAQSPPYATRDLETPGAFCCSPGERDVHHGR